MIVEIPLLSHVEDLSLPKAELALDSPAAISPSTDAVLERVLPR